MKTIIPAYWLPGRQWKKLLASKNRPWGVILNPNNGPGATYMQDYKDLSQKLADLKILRFGYIFTSYGKRAMEVIKSDIARWYSWYGIMNIFLDEVPTAPGLVEYYISLNSIIRAITILNHGTMPHEDYLHAGDILVIFEDTYKEHELAMLPEWTYKDKLMQIVHTCPKSQRKSTQRKIEESSEYGYITDRKMPNPYDRPPGY
jgi:hypothetical protein